MKKLIVFIAPRFHTNQHPAVKALIMSGYKVIFFALRKGTSEEYSALTPTIIGVSPFFSHLCKLLHKERDYQFFLKWAFPSIRSFWKTFKLANPDLVIIRDPNTVFGFLGIIFAKVCRAKVIYYTLGPKYRKTSKIKLLLRSICAGLFKAEWITPVLGNIAPGSRTIRRMHYVPLPIEPGLSPERKIWFCGGFINIMTVGKFEPRKNHILLLEAIKMLKKEFPLRLTIVGECSNAEHEKELQRVKDYIRDNQLETVVTIKTNLSYREVQALYGLHDLFVLPSRDEPLGVSVLEAMAQGIPVICSDTTGAQYYIVPEKNGYVFRTDNLADLCEKMRKIMESKAKMLEMGYASYQLVCERHNPSKYVEKIEKIAGFKKDGGNESS